MTVIFIFSSVRSIRTDKQFLQNLFHNSMRSTLHSIHKTANFKGILDATLKIGGAKKMIMCLFVYICLFRVLNATL